MTTCELCGSDQDVAAHDVEPQVVQLCAACQAAVAAPATRDQRQWNCLRESMWSESEAVKVLVYRVLKKLGDQAWAQDLRSEMYLEPETQAWADAEAAAPAESGEALKVVDSNGAPLQTGDSVTLIKDLEVKGANFTAKRGTTVKNIALTDDPKYVEGRVNGIRIVLVAAYLKKAL